MTGYLIGSMMRYMNSGKLIVQPGTKTYAIYAFYEYIVIELEETETHEITYEK